MMEANRAEAERCVDMGFEYAAGGDSAKALKMMNKALRLDPGVNLKDLRKRIENSGIKNDEKTTPTEDTSFMNGGSAYYGHDEHYNEHPADNVRSRGKFRTSKSQPTMDDATADSGVPSSSSGFSAQSSNGSTKTGVGVDRKKSHRSRTRSAGKPQLGVDYTQDECDTVQRIRHCKDYYEILNVQKDATDAHLKKEYRKLALALHPDKCRAPGATEAFKALGNAYAVLSNTEKRQRYDMYGNETPQVRHRHAGDFYEYDFGRGFEAEFTPEEIFNMFFGGGYPTGAMNRRRGGASYRFHNNDTNNAQQAEPGYGPLIQLLPLLAIFILGIIGQLMVGEPAFSLQRNGKYTDERYTKEMQIAYYVKADFLKNYRGRLQQIEQQVEDEYVTNLRMNCYRERNQKETLAWRARTFGDSAMWDKSQRMTMPNCDRLQQLYGQ